MPHLFCFGLGYTALALACRLLGEGWRVSGTCRGLDTQRRLGEGGIEAYLFDRERPLEAPTALLDAATDILVSVPPDAEGDPVLDRHRRDLMLLTRLRWLGYLSTTGVYGDTGGGTVDEDAPPKPTLDRSRRRVRAENRWLELAASHAVPVHVFRLAGIYGPGRSVIDRIRAGDARRIDRPGHLFSRIHVEDAASVLRASMARPNPGRVYNVADDEPAEPSAVVDYGCRLLGLPPPPLEELDSAAGRMSPMALSFWNDSRRVDNTRIKRELAVQLRYPSYRLGLAAIVAGDRADGPGRVVAGGLPPET
jgi:nucleoside-diphosphate-sugar epimerase